MVSVSWRSGLLGYAGGVVGGGGGGGWCMQWSSWGSTVVGEGLVAYVSTQCCGESEYQSPGKIT